MKAIMVSTFHIHRAKYIQLDKTQSNRFTAHFVNIIFTERDVHYSCACFEQTATRTDVIGSVCNLYILNQ